MKLITEENFDEVKTTITEKDDSGQKQYFIEGVYLQKNVPNRNKRVYKENVMDPEVRRYIKESIDKNRAVGELGHPEGPTINHDRVSHKIISLREEGNYWIGKSKLIDTPMGKIAKTFVDEGIVMGVSSRALGSMVMVNGINEVQNDFKLSTPADIVHEPSAQVAFVNGIMEGREWVYVNGSYEERDITEAQQMIKRASRKDILKVSMTIWEDFCNKLSGGK